LFGFAGEACIIESYMLRPEASCLEFCDGKTAKLMPAWIGVLGSTRGTSLIPVMEAYVNGTLRAEIVAVVSDRSMAPILEKGRSLGDDKICVSEGFDQGSVQR